MEDDPDVPEPLIRRSKRDRVQTKTFDGQTSNIRDVVETKEESVDEFDEPNRYRTTEGAPSTLAAKGFDQDLFEVIRGNGKRIPQVVKSWVEQYEKDPKPAMVELLTMLFEACAAKYRIQGEFLDDHVDDVVDTFVNLAVLGKIEDYQGSKKEGFRSFKDNLVLFWDNLVSEVQNGPLFDQVLFDKCMDYVIALSCTPVRVYRQVASLVGLQLVTSFIRVAKILGAQWHTTQRLLAAEKKKIAEGPRVESLNKRLSETHEKITMIEAMMAKIFEGLFVDCYLDIDPEIRMWCVQSLGAWISSHPKLFRKDSYLKNLGLSLNDKSAGVRKASVLALQRLYDVDDNVPSLRRFTEMFYKRMLDVADDIDISVAVCAISLVKQLLRHQLVPDDVFRSLYDLLYDDPPEIRHAIGALVYDHSIAQKFNSSQSHSSGDPSQIHLLRMLQIILREFSTDHISSMYVIDGIWEFMDAMKDWKCIISMLLDSHPSIELTDDDATNLTRLFCASVKKAVGERIVPATDLQKQTHTKAQREMIESSRKDITVSMMKNYPQLMRKYMADKTKVPSLVEIIVHMDLELYSKERQEQNFSTVLQLMKETFFKHGDKDALRSCVKAMDSCRTGSQGELQVFAQNKLEELEDELIIELKAAIRVIVDGKDEYSLLVNMKRLYELQSRRSVAIESLYDDMTMVLRSFRNIDDKVVSFLLLNMSLHVAWCLHSIRTSVVVYETSLSSLISKRDKIFDELEHFLQIPPEAEAKGNSGNLVARRVCTILAQLWCLFRKSTFASTVLESLGYCPEVSTLKKFWKLCEQQLDVSDEGVNEEYVEETDRDTVMIAAVTLVLHEVVPKEHLSPEIISHYVMHGTSVAQIVEYLIVNLTEKDEDVSEIFLEALKHAYGRYLVAHSTSYNESLSTKRLTECKELADRLSGFFVGADKHRLAIYKIVTNGIEYALMDAPWRLSFLTCAVINFAIKLSKPDKLGILKDLQDRTQRVNTDEDPSGWRPYLTFVDSLDEREWALVTWEKLFAENSLSKDEDSISDHDAEENQVDEDKEVPLIQSREENRGQTSRGRGNLQRILLHRGHQGLLLIEDDGWNEMRSFFKHRLVCSK